MANKHLKDIIRETTEVLKDESHQNEALHEIHPNDVERVLRRGLDTILENLVQGNKIYLINSFNLEPKDYDAKHVKNPQTGEPMIIEPYRAILIKPSDSAKKRLKIGKKTYPLK
ncbi:HU family DNA-binding protein [Paenibacillus amylolyticus]|uniref:HU family DNA-binding protein n=1 Tax=Paenibacillus amylolyticus TaxID=1451 RepID=UPI003EBE7AEB